MQLYKRIGKFNRIFISFYGFSSGDYIKKCILIKDMENINSIQKERVIVLTNFFIAYSSFIGVLSAIIYYIANLKGISIMVTHAIVIFYILVALILSYWIILSLNKREE